jgi:RHS repeat-associated protein
VALSRGDGTYTFTGQHIGSAWGDEDVWYPGDVNGDAKTDLIHIFRKPPDRTTPTEHGGFRVGLSDATGGSFRWVGGDTTFPWYRPSGSLTRYPSPWLVGDVDGDRRADIVSVSDVTTNGVRSQDLAVVFAGPNDTFTTDPAYLRGVQPGGWNWETPEQVPAHLGDLNGDGKADLVFTPWRAPGFKYPLELLGHLSPNRGLDMDGWHPADVDGNGRQDLVYAYFRNPGYTIYTLLQQSDGSYQRVEDGVDFVNTPGALADLNTPDTTGWLAADVGGGPGKAADGRADLVYVDHVADRRLTVYSLLSDGNGRFRHKAQAFLLAQGAEFPTGREARRWLTADVNGDGRTDLVNAYNEGGEARIHLLTSTGDGGWSWTRYGFFLGLVPGDGPSWQAADVNGDGRADLVMAALQGGKTIVRTLLSNGDASWTPVTEAPVTTAGADAPAFGDTRRWLELEANGDGLADLGYVEPVVQGARVHTLTSIGNGRWKAESSPTLPVPSDYYVSDAVAFRRLDVNGDGRTDLVHLSAYLNQSGTLDTAAVLLTNRSPGWSVQPQRDIPFHIPDAVNWRPMDRDGDGRSDLAYLQPDLQTLRLPVAADLVGRVVSPLGGESQIAYRPSSAFGASQVNGQANGPAGGNCHLPLGVVRDAVASVTVSDGRSSAPSKVTYAYACAGWSDAERGFLGWEQVYEFRPSTTAQPGGTVLNQYELTDQCLAHPVYQQLYDASGKAFDKTITAYLPPGGAAPYRCLVNFTNHILLNQWVAAPNDYTYYTYDEFGNVTSVLEQGDPQVAGDDRYTSHSYHPATGPYVVGLPSGEQLHEGADSSGKVLRARMYCYDGDTSLTCTAVPTKGLLSARKELNLQGLADLAVTTFAYDATGNLAGVKDPDGNISTLFYDPSHTHPTKACNALQQCDEYTWDRATGRVTEVVDQRGLHTILGYDVLGRLTSVASPSGGQYARQYLDDGKPATQRVRERLADGTPDGLWREVLLDGLGRPYREVQKGATPGVRFEQDTSYVGASMLPATRSDWHGAARPPHRGVFERFAYDPAGRLVTQTHPDGAALRWEYGTNSDNDWVKAIDELGHERRTYTDAHGRTVRVAEWVDGKPADVAYSWSAADELRTVTDPGGHVTTFTYDNRGRRTGADDPDRGKWSWTYDLVGNQLTQTDARKLTVTFTYDALNRVKTKADPDGRLRTWRYDEPVHPNGLGRLTSVTDSFETACPGKEAGWFGYDAAGHAITVRQCVAGTTLELGSGYDSLGRQKSLTYPDGETVTYEYDLAGRLWRMPGYVDAMAYDAAGRLTAADYANGTHAIWDVDARRGWLNKATVTGPAGTLYEATYQYLANGAAKSTRSSTSKMNLDYGYDELNRLTSVSGDVAQNFHYNPSGDITQNSALGTYIYPTPPANGCGVQAPHLCPHAVTSIAMPAGGESFKYDDDGNLTLANRVSANGAIKTRSIEWNADGKPTVIEDYDGVATQVRYDAFGTRTYRERDGQATVFFGNLVDRSWPTAGGTVKTTKHYFAGPLRVASADAGGTSWHTTDTLGSPRARTGPQGTLLDRTDYQPFGSLLGTAAGGPPGEVGFTGARTDSDNGLVDLNARWYDPHLGRFVSADPMLPMPARSQALNPYAYAENNPVSLTDPSGTQACAPAQETCLAVAEPPAPAMRFEPMTIEGHWVAPEDRVHTGCQSCTLLGTATEASAAQALRLPAEPAVGMGTIAATQPPPSVPPLTAPDTSATAVVIITHDYGIGSHAALWVDSSRGPLLFDPGGSFQEDTRGSGAFFEDEDADLEAYVAFQEGTGSQVSTYRFPISQQDASEIVERIAPSDLSNGIGGSPGFCSISVCRALTGVGPFKDLSIDVLPGGLERELRSIQGEPSLGEQVMHWMQVFGLKSNPLFVPRF